jgi:hypothetical protein
LLAISRCFSADIEANPRRSFGLAVGVIGATVGVGLFWSIVRLPLC